MEDNTMEKFDINKEDIEKFATPEEKEFLKEENTPREEISKRAKLWDHLRYKFYPHPSEDVIRNIISLFQEYWDNKIPIEDLSEKTGIDIDELYKRFDFFINEDDLVTE